MTVADVKSLPSDQYLIQPCDLLTTDSYEYVKPYLAGVASVHFVAHKHPTGFSFSTINASLAVWNYIKSFKPEILHFEGYTLRTIGMMPFLFKFKKVFMTIHDPVPHSGEQSWKISLPNFLFFYLPFKKRFLFYSEFARNLFINHYKKVKELKLLVHMQPFYAYQSLVEPNVQEKKHILFFGRLSPYKGVDVLLAAMQTVLKSYPNEVLVVAGKSVNGYTFDDSVLGKYPNNIIIHNRYIPNKELMALISSAKFVVCPYLDATQSGVLMTTFALNTPVIASNVGSFPEFVKDAYNGLLVPPNNPLALAEKIKLALKNDFYKQMQDNIVLDNSHHNWQVSLRSVLDEYITD